MSAFKINVIILAISIGVDEILYPYIIQDITPVKNIINVIRETSSAFFVLRVFISCGRKASVVNMAAKYPKNSTLKVNITRCIDLKNLKVISCY